MTNEYLLFQSVGHLFRCMLG